MPNVQDLSVRQTLSELIYKKQAPQSTRHKLVEISKELQA